ncbi:MAG TPA: heavy metal response regulator transcription factor [Candidatus Didemnitutus sp.]|nr:heavy metal response regulator transcription factor [Candidatus Didemnitutus sp.]
MRVLVIEDEPKAAAFLRRGLEENGCTVAEAQRGDEGLTMARTSPFDAIVLDVNLPVLSGFGVLAALRESGNVTPVLCLTARDAVSERIKGLELGADDYLVKPYSFAELLARLRSVARRRAVSPERILRVADLEIDPPRLRATRGGHRLDLTAKEFQLLALLVSRTGEVLSRTVLASEVWDMNFDSDSNVVDVAIRRLRSKVDDPFPTKLVHTIRGVGYVLDPGRK